MDRQPFLEAGARHSVLGLEPGTVRLSEYTPLWAKLFLIEAAHLRYALDARALDIQHVGSTAVPGLKAKPILDIAIAIPALALVPECASALTPLGYRFADRPLDDDFVFEKGIKRTHHVHLVELDGGPWRDYIRFRDSLRGDDRLREEYERIKLDLCGRFYGNRACYTSAKAVFIRHVLAGR